MANLATALSPLPIKLFDSVGGGGLVIPVLVVFDTADSDLTIDTPAADEYSAIVGMQYAEASAHTLTVKSGTTTLVAYEKTTNTEVNDKLGDGIKAVSKLGEALKLRCTTAVISTMLVYVTRFKMLKV